MLTLGGLRRGALAVAAALGLVVMVGCAPATNTGQQRGATPSPSSTSVHSAGPTIAPSSGSAGASKNDGEAPGTKPSSPPVPPAGTANVQIANARYDQGTSAIVVTAMVTDRISSTGTCALEASSGSASLTTQAAAVADATVTYCGPLAVTVPPGSSGTWSISVSYTDGPINGLIAGKVTVP
ncbi:MAG: hypothetical protein ABI255_04290 [Microbacteriaceae bacterium]